MAGRAANKPRANKSHQLLPLEGSLGFMLREVGRAVGRVLAARLDNYGITVSTWFVLRLLADETGLTQRELSHRLGILEPSAVETLRLMESRGLITRTRNPSDRRKVHIGLSDKGSALLEDLMPIAFEMNALIEQCGTPGDLDALRRLLGNLRAILAITPDSRKD